VRRIALALVLAVPLVLLAACAGAPGRPQAASVRRAASATVSSGVPGVLPASTATTVAPTLAPAPATPRRASASPLVDVDPSIPVDLRYATAGNFTGAPLPGYQANRALLRPAAAAALARAQQSLRAEGLTLVVLDAYRPVRATLAMVAWAKRVGRPELIGPYIAGRSQHNLGTAVDVTLARVLDGQPGGRQLLDMGAPFDTFGPGASYSDATGAAVDNRRHLRAALMTAGFAPYDTEWWHFSVSVPGATPLDLVIGPRVAPSPAPAPLIVERVRTIGTAQQQVIVVTSSSWSSTTASLEAFERDGAGTPWRRVAGPVTAYVGRTGFSDDKHEGDGKTPVGVYGFGTAFGTAGDPGVHLPYRQTTSADVWVDDPASSLYNTWQQEPADRRWVSAERLYQAGPYHYAAVIHYNGDLVPGRGSAIFLHVSQGHPTAGCVAVPEPVLLQLLRWLDPARAPVIAMGPTSYLTG
jgi:D-alanyl-D-alanine dipeptidase/L,D-peptidoglycan transpeptidase YkuD (ErfK/YbiS/YcfS/YnhG family)